MRARRNRSLRATRSRQSFARRFSVPLERFSRPEPHPEPTSTPPPHLHLPRRVVLEDPLLFRRHCRIHRFCRRCASFRRSRIQALAEILRLLSSGFRACLSLDILARGSPTPLARAKRHRLRVFVAALRSRSHEAANARFCAPFLARAPHPSVERARAKGQTVAHAREFSSRIRRRDSRVVVDHDANARRSFARRFMSLDTVRSAPAFARGRARVLRGESPPLERLSKPRCSARGSPPLAKRHRLRVFRQTLRCALRQRAMAPLLARARATPIRRTRAKGQAVAHARESFLRGFSREGWLLPARRSPPPSPHSPTP